jgi:hypothetical protein
MTEEGEQISCGASSTIGMTCPAKRSYCDVRAGQDSAICCRKAAPEGSCKNKCGHLNRVNSATYVSTGTSTGTTTRRCINSAGETITCPSNLTVASGSCTRYTKNADGTKNCLN